MKNAKGQIKFGETFGIIIIVYIILMVGLIWYNNVNSNNLKEMNDENKMDMAFEKYHYIVNSNLLHLSEQGDIDEEFDITSLRVFEGYSKNDVSKEIVRKQLGYSLVQVELLDMGYNPIENITIYNNTLKDYSNIENFRTLIPISDNKKVHVGILTVSVYS